MIKTLEAQELFSQKIYWLNRLSGELPETNLIQDYVRPLQYSGKNKSHSFELPLYLSQEIIKLTKGSHFLVYIILLSAFKILLQKYTRNNDLIVGIPVYKKIDNINLDYLNDDIIVPLRTQLNNGITFKNYLIQVRDTVIKAYSHQDYCFDELIEVLNLPKSQNRCPIFDIVVLLENIHSKANLEKNNNDITISFTVENDTISGSIEYNELIFKNETIKLMSNYYINVIESIINNIDIKISDIGFLNDSDKRKLLKEYNNKVRDYPITRTINDLFEEQVNKTPNNIAVVHEKTKLTYEELNEKANQLAVMLRKLGVHKGEFVGIYKDRDINFLIGILAIYKAGGAYVPIDSTYPSNRIEYMLSNSEVRFLLTDFSLLNTLTDLIGNCSQLKYIICLDEIVSENVQLTQKKELTIYDKLNFNSLPKDNTEQINEGSDPAYMLYTSGSTGLPKGAIVRHDGAVNHIYAEFDEFELTSEFSFLQSAPSSTDISVWQFLAPLLIGGKTVIVDIETVAIPDKLFKVLFSEEITVVELVPALFTSLLEYTCSLPIHSRELPLLKWMMVVGEPVSVSKVNKWLEIYPEIKIVNAYGPTEAADDITQFIVNKPRDENQRTVPIGKPLANLNLYILDSQMKLLPIGVPGEICVSGIGVGAGYWKNEEKTKDSFVPNPFTNARKNLPGNRQDLIYKTGDLGRWLADGNIEFLGRIDNQVKIRGFRVELGEIETFLLQHQAVKEVVVVVREDNPEDQRLVAYVVPRAEFQDDPSSSELVQQLRDFLTEKLPGHMIPSAIVLIEALPLAPSGKVDRRALPAPNLNNESEFGFVAPRTPTEEIVADIWNQVLKQEHIGIHDNFFNLGGHSLLATQAISKLREAFKIELPLRSLFEQPTVAQLAKQVEDITRQRNVFLVTQRQPICPVKRQSQLPLSFAQQRLWFIEELTGVSQHVDVPTCLHFKGSLNIVALESTLKEIVRRHEVLRTTFKSVEGRAIQVIYPTLNLALPIVDCQELPEPKREIEIQRLIDSEASRCFNLTEGPLFRCILLHLNKEEHILLFTIHHIVTDGWSMGVMIRELTTIYKAFSQNQASPLPELSIQYADFAVWQRQYLHGVVLDNLLTYWKQKLSGNLPILQLPIDYPRPAIQTFSGKRESFFLSADLTRGLKTFSRNEDVTLFMTLLTAFKTLLHRYSGQDDILVGSPIANRNQDEIEQLIGFFVNTLVLRTNFSGNPSFQELLRRIRETTLEAYAHQDIPFELLVDELEPQRNLSYTPLFQVMFVLHNAPMPPLEMPGLALTPLETSNNRKVMFDLALHITETEEGLLGSLDYNTDLFEENTISRMAGHLQRLCEVIVTNPQQRLSELSILTEFEQHQLLREWNNTKIQYPQKLCIHKLFEAQVERTPDTVAVVFGKQQLSYRELNTKANQLAHYLRSLGVKPEVLVGICVERSLEMVIGLLAILKAGGAYVPLDPNYPQERLAYMLEDSQPSVLLTQQYLLESLPSHKAQVICIDSDWEKIADKSTENLASNITIDNLAYVIYTSGSTGKPKGAMNTHSGICNRLLWMQNSYQLTSVDAVLQKTPFSFDVSVWEFFWPLITGARLIVAQPEGHRDPNYLVNLILQQQITTLHFVPSMLQVFLEAEGLEKCQSLVRVISSGEALPVQLQQRFFNLLDAQLHNLYGPTETAVDVTFWQCKRDGVTNQNTVPIGCPITNIEIYILDKYLNPVPVGVSGEIHIGGVGVGRGYLNRPDLSAEKFIPNPFSKEATRLYKTGDLACYLPNGEIEYIGRIDNQVKIRGFRIELGEIEAVISQYPVVRETVVTVHCSEVNSQQIVAYVVPNQEQTPSISELKSFLETKLPNYMVPKDFVILDTLPLTPNGKVDRKALPVPDTARLKDTEIVPPRNYLETKLAEIWSDVLGVDKVGIFDNFFELGGDSILAIVVITKANQAGLQLSVKQLFQHQTVVDLASVAVRKKVNQAEQGLITGLTSLTPIQHWFFEQNLLEPHHWNQAVLLEVKQVLDLTVLEKSIKQLLLHHDTLRLRFEQTESGWQQVIANSDVETPLTYFDFSKLSESEQELAIEASATKLQASLNLSASPLIRVALFDLGQYQLSRLLVIVHHLAVDGVSWRILLEDLETVYQQFSQDKKIQLPAKTTSFKYWSEYLHKYVKSATLQQEWDYWLTEEWQQIAPLPVDFPDGDNTVASVENVSISLTVEQTQALLKEVPKAYNTQINDVLLTALIEAFSQWTGSKSLLLALEGHGREEIFDDVDLSRTVGWFTSIFPVLLDLEKVSNTIESLKLIKEQLRGIPNKGIGYSVLRYLSQDIAKVELLRLLPRPEVVFNYLGQFDRTFSDSSIFKILQNSPGQTRSLSNRETYMLSIDALVIDNQLRVDWTYSKNIHRRSTIEKLAKGFLEALLLLVIHCQSSEDRGYTPSDFPEADLSQQDLERFLGKIN